MTIVIVQCRLSSTRLPQKALLPLGNKPVIAWTLEAMNLVPAKKHILAVDYDSEEILAPIAKEYGFECIAGSTEDVLDRFCAVAQKVGCLGPTDIILRATADNPFLFYEAAIQLLEEMKKNPCDYITFTGLPHGSGVEVFNARSMIEACGMTDLAYDHEHVGPALYNHPNDFACTMLPAPGKWNHPDYRTTIDTYADYRRALRIVKVVSGNRNLRRPFTYEEICNALEHKSVINPILCIPSVSKGHGTGHLRRCLNLAIKNLADVYIPTDANLSELDSLVEKMEMEGLEKWQIISEFPTSKEYSLIITDYFSIPKQLIKDLSTLSPVASIDEGSSFTQYCDYLLDIIPSAKLNRVANLSNPGFIPLPKTRKSKDDALVENNKVLVSIGGEDPANLSLPISIALAECNKNVTVISANPLELRKQVPEELLKNIRIVPPVNNLKERLYMYDIVVTHYGFTAFEALAAGCGVLLLETTSLHGVLAHKYGFALLRKDEISSEHLNTVLKQTEKLYPTEILETLLKNKDETLDNFVKKLSAGNRIPCPICLNWPQNPDSVIARTKKHTFRRCNNCGILYMSFSTEEKKDIYNTSYFFDDYKAQYGKTYLEDYQNIKSQCVRRMSIIDSIFWSKFHKSSKIRRNSTITPSVLDIGCAMGPFIDAAADSGWQVYGTDISSDAVEYVQNTLHYPAVCASFPDFDPISEFGIKMFNAISMWFVIEHFKDLDSVFNSVSKMLKLGGIFAFSTPSASGVSGKYSPESFFNSSPSDHYTLWEPKKTDEILKKYGFKVVKKIYTGHHPERFPCAKKKSFSPGSLRYSFLNGFSKVMGLGDTFEVYCIKTGEIQDKKERT